MFDVTSSKLLILGVVALLVVGPKDLPALLRTIGRYMGIIKRHAAEFRAQFDEAMREAELEDLKKEVEGLGNTAEAHVRAAGQSLEAELGNVNASIGAPHEGASQAISEPGGAATPGDAVTPDVVTPDVVTHGAVTPSEAAESAGAPHLDGKDGKVAAAELEDSPESVHVSADPAARAPEKSGA
jgi:sec-independent protein translocase protein TatB